MKVFFILLGFFAPLCLSADESSGWSDIKSGTMKIIRGASKGVKKAADKIDKKIEENQREDEAEERAERKKKKK